MPPMGACSPINPRGSRARVSRRGCRPWCLDGARDHSAAALVTYAVCFGITIGGSDLYFVALLRRRFPTVSLAYSYSAWYFCEILTLLLAGPAAGRVFDLTGNYDATLALLAGSAVLAAALSLFLWRGAAAERALRTDAQPTVQRATAD